VVLASGGYPGRYSTGYAIRGLEGLPGDLQVFHAGTAFKEGQLVNSGGRVLGVTAAAANIAEAVARVYAGVENIYFEGMHYRRDIGQKALLREGF
jgi:phosphoribosylamine--glycine ligase